MLVPEWGELAAAWCSGKNSGPGWLELGAVVGEVSDHFEGQISVCSEDKRDLKIIGKLNRRTMKRAHYVIKDWSQPYKSTLTLAVETAQVQTPWT